MCFLLNINEFLYDINEICGKKVSGLTHLLRVKVEGEESYASCKLLSLLQLLYTNLIL